MDPKRAFIYSLNGIFRRMFLCSEWRNITELQKKTSLNQRPFSEECVLRQRFSTERGASLSTFFIGKISYSSGKIIRRGKFYVRENLHHLDKISSLFPDEFFPDKVFIFTITINIQQNFKKDRIDPVRFPWKLTFLYWCTNISFKNLKCHICI